MIRIRQQLHAGAECLKLRREAVRIGDSRHRGHVAAWVLGAASLMLRGEVVRYGEYQYDDANTMGQSAYSIANFRAGLRGKRLYGEGWVRNAFDTRYVPIAFPYPGLAPSGFIGESGAPRTFGLRAGVTF